MSQETFGQHLWSIGGYHPTTGDFAYFACQCFTTREAAEEYQRRERAKRSWWALQEVVGHSVTTAVFDAVAAKDPM